MTPAPLSAFRLEVCSVCPTERRQALRRLFELVFGAAVSDEHWQWKYAGPPGSTSLHVVACAPGGEPIGHVGAVVQPAWCRSVSPRPLGSLPRRSRAQSAWMAHLTDVMVHPAHRGGLDQQGIYPRIMATMAEQLGHWQTEWRAPVYAYGFPGVTPSRLGQRMGLYRPLYRVREFAVTGPEHPGWGWRLDEHPLGVGFSPRLRAELDSLDRYLAGRLAPNGPPRLRKGAAYIQWRYAAHPARPYRMHLLRDPFGRLRGWRITRAQPRPVVVDAQSHTEAQRARLWAGLPSGFDDATTPWRGWFSVGDASPCEESLIVPVEFQVPGPTGGWPAPAFAPGDTDVF